MKVNVITLFQPWASLVVMGAKTFETRSWDTKYRGELFIHSSGVFTTAHKELCLRYPFNKYITGDLFKKMPLGKIIGRVELTNTYTTQEAAYKGRSSKIFQRFNGNVEQSDIEWQFGDYGADRFAWELANAVPFDEQHQIVIPGKLKIWKAEIDL